MNNENESEIHVPVREENSGERNNTLMGILSYIGLLVIIPYFVAKDEAFVKFHIKQGLVLLIIEVAVWVVGSMVWMLWPVLQIVNLGAIILSIIGIVHVVQNKQKELPLIGQFAQHIKI